MMNSTEFTEFIVQLCRRVDAHSVDALSAFLADEVSFRFANAQPLTQFSVPFATILKLQCDRIVSYLIYADVSAL